MKVCVTGLMRLVVRVLLVFSMEKHGTSSFIIIHNSHTKTYVVKKRALSWSCYRKPRLSFAETVLLTVLNIHFTQSLVLVQQLMHAHWVTAAHSQVFFRICHNGMMSALTAFFPLERLK